MCSRVKCRKCGKFTWAGCGTHIEQVLAGIPEQDRCQGHTGAPGQGGIFGSLFG